MKQAKYEPKLIRPTAGEIKNGWTDETLLEYLRQSSSTEYEFRRELYARAKHHESLAHAEVAKFKRHEDLDDRGNQKRLAELEREAAEATADAGYAADRFVEADGVAA